jgi:hypothetical protein
MIEKLPGENVGAHLSEDQNEQRNDFERRERINSGQLHDRRAQQVTQRRVKSEERIAPPSVQQSGPPWNQIAFGKTALERSGDVVMERQVSLNTEGRMSDADESERCAYQKPDGEDLSGAFEKRRL